jgi:hypothetical protein
MLAVTSSSSSFRAAKLIRDGGSGKLLLECRTTGKRRHVWVVYNAKGHELLHVRLTKPSWWQRLRQRRGDAGALPYELTATEPHHPQPCIVGRAEEGRLVLRACSKIKGQEGTPMAEAELFKAAFPATLGGQGGGSTQAGAAGLAASGSSGSSQSSSLRGVGVHDSPRSPAAVPPSPRALSAAGGSAPNTPRSLRRASISSTSSAAAAAAMAAGPSPGVVWEVGCHLAVAPRAETPLMVALCTIYKAALDRRAVDAVREIKAAAAKAAAKAAKAQQRAERARQAAATKACKAGGAGGSAGGAGAAAGSSSAPPSPTSSRSGSITASGGSSPLASVSVATPLRSLAGRSPTLSSVGEIEEEVEDVPQLPAERSLRQQYSVQPVTA